LLPDDTDGKPARTASTGGRFTLSPGGLGAAWTF
jgi:hypothetical protein